MKLLRMLPLLLALHAPARAQADLARIQSLYDEGTRLYNSGERAKGVESFEEGLALARESGNALALRTFVSNLSLAYNFLNNFEKGLPLAKENLALARQTRDAGQVHGALLVLGQLSMGAGKYREAALVFSEMLELAAGLGNKPEMLKSLADIGVAWEKAEDYVAAIGAQEKALRLARELGDLSAQARALNRLGVNFNYQGDAEMALSLHKQAVALRRKLGEPKALGAALLNLGNAYDTDGDSPLALRAYREALDLARANDDPEGISQNLGNLGIIHNKIGEYQKALTYFEEELKSARGGGDKREIAGAMNNIGLVFSELGQMEKAEASFEGAADIFREIGNRSRLVAALTNLGNAEAKKGHEKTSRAQDYYAQALGEAQKLGIPNEDIQAAMADALMDGGDLNGAEVIYKRLGDPRRLGRLALGRKDFAAAAKSFESVLPYDLERRHADFLFVDYCGLGSAALGLKDYAKAADYFERAITRVEDQRDALADGERGRFFAAESNGFARIVPYKGLVRALAAQGNLDSAFRAAENLKARQLAEAIAKGRAQAALALPEEQRIEQSRLTDSLRAVRKQLESLFLAKKMTAYKAKEAELASGKKALADFVSRLRRSHPEYAAVNYPQPLGGSQVLLAPEETLLEFEVTPERTFLFILSGVGKTLAVREIAVSRDELAKLALAYRDYFQAVNGPADLARFDAKAGKKLFDLLFGETLSGLPEGSILILVPDDILGVLPFEALAVSAPVQEQVGEGKFGPFPLGVKYLGDRYSVSYAQSATSLTLLRSLKARGAVQETALAVADPIFSPRDTRAASAGGTNATAPALSGALGDWKTMGPAGLKARGGSAAAPAEVDLFPRLEKTREIAAGMKGLFGDALTILQDGEARKDALLKLPLADYKYIAFATHGILDSAVPYIKQPALVLGQLGHEDPAEGFLTMSEVTSLRLGAEMVALTACDTGVGKAVKGEGVMGMGRAFQFAGAENVLMSLWSVAEDATVALSVEFFKELKGGKSPREALRLARASVRRQGWEHPFFWSAFILMGR